MELSGASSSYHWGMKPNQVTNTIGSTCHFPVIQILFVNVVAGTVESKHNGRPLPFSVLGAKQWLGGTDFSPGGKPNITSKGRRASLPSMRLKGVAPVLSFTLVR